MGWERGMEVEVGRVRGDRGMEVEVGERGWRRGRGRGCSTHTMY